MLRRLGFGESGRRERFVVLQSDLLVAMDTAIVAPLDDSVTMYDEDPLAVPVPAAEAGTAGPQVVLPHLLTALPLSRFESQPVGRLSLESMSSIDVLLRTVLHLP